MTFSVNPNYLSISVENVHCIEKRNFLVMHSHIDSFFHRVIDPLANEKMSQWINEQIPTSLPLLSNRSFSVDGF